MRSEEEIRKRIEERVKELEWAISHTAHMKMERMDGAIRELRWMLGEEKGESIKHLAERERGEGEVRK